MNKPQLKMKIDLVLVVLFIIGAIVGIMMSYNYG